MKKKQWVIDYETLKTCFVLVAEDLFSSDIKVFVISHHQNDLSDLISFYQECQETKSWHFGFNSIGFDGQITEFIIRNKEELLKLSNKDVITKIYQFSQKVIESEFAVYKQEQFTIPTVDIYYMNHWNSNSKRASLKWCQFSMDWFNVQEMPFEHSDIITKQSDIDSIVSYCINDVRSTKAIFLLKDSKGNQTMLDQIKLRSELSKKYYAPLYSASEPTLSKEIFLHYLSEKMKSSKEEIKKFRTFRKNVAVKNIIFPYVKFKTHTFNKVLNWFKDLVVDTTVKDDDEENEKISLDVQDKEISIKYALGGLHGCIESQQIVPNEDQMIVTADVVSFYPRLSIENELAPAQIPKELFCSLYKELFDERKKYPKGTSLNYVLKIVLNSTYGLSKSKYAYLYDPLFTYSITVNGQLLLTMLYEMISIALPDAKPLMINTDGLEFLIRKDQFEIYQQVCKEWMKITNLELEFDEYSKLFIRDVNNYIGIYKNGKYKLKGVYDYEDLPLHKNKSYSIIPKAIKAHLIDGLDPEEFIRSCKDIFSFCAGTKANKGWKIKEIGIKDRSYYERNISKIVRYYVSNRGSKLIKYKDTDEINLLAGKWMLTEFNVFEEKPFEEYDINYDFYIEEVKKQIELLTNNPSCKKSDQLTLF